MLPLAGAPHAVAPAAGGQGRDVGVQRLSRAATHYYVQIAAVYGRGRGRRRRDAIGATVGPLAVPASGVDSAVVGEARAAHGRAERDVGRGAGARVGARLRLRPDHRRSFDRQRHGDHRRRRHAGADAVDRHRAERSTPTPRRSRRRRPRSRPTRSRRPRSASWQLVANDALRSPRRSRHPPAAPRSRAAADLLVSWARAADGGRGARRPLRPDDRRRPVDGGQPVRCAASRRATTQATSPGSEIVAGPLLVDAEFLVGSCPLTADGCVMSEAIASSRRSPRSDASPRRAGSARPWAA